MVTKEEIAARQAKAREPVEPVEEETPVEETSDEEGSADGEENEED